MNLYFRLLVHLLLSGGRTRQRTSEVCTCTFRVWPGDIDVFGHMNNGRFCQHFDIARAVWMRRTGILRCLLQQRWGAVLGGQTLRFHRPLRIGARYQVTTRLLGWDERWFYLEHRAEAESGDLIALGVCRAALVQRGRWIPCSEVVDAVEPDAHRPPLPAAVEQWLAADKALIADNAPCPPASCLSPAPLERRSFGGCR